MAVEVINMSVAQARFLVVRLQGEKLEISLLNVQGESR
jgi:hypothetical protein